MRRADRELSSLKKAVASKKETKTVSQNYYAHRLGQREREREMTLDERSHHVCTFSISDYSSWRGGPATHGHSP